MCKDTPTELFLEKKKGPHKKNRGAALANIGNRPTFAQPFETRMGFPKLTVLFFPAQMVKLVDTLL
jgi:hypothetical protein